MIRLKLILSITLLTIAAFSVSAQQKLSLTKTGFYQLDSTQLNNYPNINISSQLEAHVSLISLPNNHLLLFNPPNISTDPEYQNERLNIYSNAVDYKIAPSQDRITTYQSVVTSNSGVQLQNVDTLYLSLHFEEDKKYYQGDNTNVNKSQRTDGEGWVWAILNKNQKLTVTMPPLVSSMSLPINATIRVRGISKDQSKAPDHKITVSLFGTNIENTFNGYTYSQSNFQFTTKTNSSNNFIITSNGITGTTVDQIYVDYFKINGSFSNVLDTTVIEIKSLDKAKLNDSFLTIKSNIKRSFVLLDTLTKKIVYPELLDSSSARKIITFNIQQITANNVYLVDLKSSSQTPTPTTVLLSDIETTDENYILITHPDFIEFATEYKSYKSTDLNYKIKIVDTDNIYYHYSNNSVTPYAIKAYLNDQYAKNSKLKYVLLVGNSSWDYRNLTSSGSKKRDYVPTYGNPTSDQWLVSLNPQKPYQTSLVIGRLPLNSNKEGFDYIEKMKLGLSSLKNNSNVKKFTFINGGINTSEQRSFLNQTQKIINDFVRSPQVMGSIDTIIKRTIGYEYAGYETPKIQQAFLDGTVWVNYIGHAGSRTWDLMLNDPNQLPDTKTVFPFITSMTCFTGDFANPNQESFSETFVLNPTKGALAFMGTSGLGYVNYDEIMIRQIYNSLLLTNNKNLAEGITAAKNYLEKTYGNSTYAQEIIREYIYIGDPTLTLPISTFPDISISNRSSISQIDNKNFNLNLIYNNIGKIVSDSVVISITDQIDGTNEVLILKKEKFADMEQEFQQQLTFSKPGLHTIRVDINWKPNINPLLTNIDSLTTNNVMDFSLFIPANDVEFFNLSTGQILTDENQTIYLFAPKQENLTWSVKSTNNQTVRSGAKAVSGYDSLMINLSGLSSDYYQLNYSVGSDTSIYKLTFKVAPNSKPNSFIYPEKIRFNSNKMSFTDGKISFKKGRKAISLTSASYASGGYGNISVGDTTILATNPNPAEGTVRSLLVVRIDKQTKKIKDLENFDVYLTNAESDRAEQWIRSRMNSGDLFALVVSHDATRKALPGLKNVITQLGSQKFSTLAYNTSWAFLGSLSSGKIIEAVGLNIEEKVSIETQVEFSYDQSSFVVLPSPQKKIDKIKFSNQTAIDTFSVLTYPHQNLTEILPNTSVELTHTIDSLRFSLFNSSISDQPVFTFDEVNYVMPIPTGIIGKGISKQNIKVGEPFDIRFMGFHTLLDSIENVKYQLEIKKNNTSVLTQQITGKKNYYHKVLDFQVDQNKLVQVGNYDYLITIKSEGVYPNFSAVSGSFEITASAFDPQLNLTINGRTIDTLSTQYIPKSATFDFELSYSDYLPLTDTLDVLSLTFNNESITWENHISFINEGDVRKTKIHFEKNLTTGTYYINFGVKTPYGQYTQSPKTFSYLVKVVEDDALTDVLNFPNPFKDRTRFNFMITGAEQPVSGRILIYTINGLKIQTIDFVPELGMNTIEWDGRDRDLDQIANGIYLYKVIVEFKNTKKEVIQKILKLE